MPFCIILYHICSVCLHATLLLPNLFAYALNIVWCRFHWTLGSKLQWNLNRNSNIFSQEMYLNMSSGKWRPFALGLNVLNRINYIHYNSALQVWRVVVWLGTNRFNSFSSGLRHNYCHGPFIRYLKLRVAHAPGMPGTFSPPSRISDRDMHHGTCVTHVPWCMPGSLTSCFLWNRWREKPSRHTRRMRNPQFYVSGKRPLKYHAYQMQSNADGRVSSFNKCAGFSQSPSTCLLSYSCIKETFIQMGINYWLCDLLFSCGFYEYSKWIRIPITSKLQTKPAVICFDNVSYQFWL